MTDELREKLESLRSIAPRLNQTTDQAAAVIKATDAFLEGLGLGVEAYASWFKHTEYRDGDGGDRRSTNSHLAYGRINGKFAIHVAHLTNRLEACSYGSGEDEIQIEQEVSPWASSPRQDKLKSFATLPALLDAILENANELAERAEAAAKLVGEMMESLAVPQDEPKVPSKRRGRVIAALAQQAAVEREGMLQQPLKK